MWRKGLRKRNSLDFLCYFHSINVEFLHFDCAYLSWYRKKLEIWISTSGGIACTSPIPYHVFISCDIGEWTHTVLVNVSTPCRKTWRHKCFHKINQHYATSAQPFSQRRKSLQKTPWYKHVFIYTYRCLSVVRSQSTASSLLPC